MIKMTVLTGTRITSVTVPIITVSRCPFRAARRATSKAADRITAAPATQGTQPNPPAGARFFFFFFGFCFRGSILGFPLILPVRPCRGRVCGRAL